jgi:hypothetical protein
MRRNGGWVVLCGVLASAACNGFPDPEPIEQAEKRPEKYPSYSQSGAPTVVTVERQRWIVLPGEKADVPSRALQPLATGGGGSMFTAAGDQAPFDALYARLPDGSLHVARELR